MSAEESIGAQIEARGWRTGSVIAAASLTRLADLARSAGRNEFAALVDGSQPIIVSQWCDLVHHCEIAEPFFEVLLAKQLGTLDPNRGPGRSSRHLQVKTHSLGVLELSIHSKMPLPRAGLLELQPDKDLELSFDEAMAVMGWIGKRYFRVPLPSALTRRMPFNKDPVRAKFKKITRDVHEVRVSVTPADMELGKDAAYLVHLYLIFRTQAQIAAAATSIDWLKTWAQALNGVHLHIRPRTADSFSYAEALGTVHLDLDSLTYGSNGGPSEGLMPLLA